MSIRIGAYQLVCDLRAPDLIDRGVEIVLHHGDIEAGKVEKLQHGLRFHQLFQMGIVAR